ncbi:transcriptional regulator [Serinibacter arcticus]|uniref:Transcriptional regulator n=1 Tax=Serinibacter arcticus TaxID=1655435 RepID=A0A2U1ZSI3_9MICO|nr:metalloregulator ArsR/SmtB family transcription factor [Serinibacter arcticus]PWD49882.1 transcriptional regulator [Serinibacter arcticus]
METGISEAAELFKVLGSEPRLWLLRLLSLEPRTVGSLADATKLPQPLVSQHLRTLRLTGLVTTRKEGRSVVYALADEHVAHVIADALVHVQEPRDAHARTNEEEPA